MPQEMVARVTCPNCQQPFQVRAEQVLDVRDDPSAKSRVLNGAVNVAMCPNCQMRGGLHLPFIYHDPENELALVFMPMEAAQNEVERQQEIGRLTSALMDSLPAEDRKGYLLQPQIFLSHETLVKEILKAEGVTEEMMAEQEAKAELLSRMLDTSSDEVLGAMIKENNDKVDAAFFQLLTANLRMAQSAGQSEQAQKLLDLQSKLFELTSEGRKLRARAQVLDRFQEEPTRERLLDLLVDSQDQETRELLVTYGLSLLDYRFFQLLTARVDGAEGDERERLAGLRKEILRIRDEIEEVVRAEYEARAGLLRDLLLSDDPEALARRRRNELDDTFMNMLLSSINDAERAGNQEAVKSLRAIYEMISGLFAEGMPAELRLFNQLMEADEDEIDSLLEENEELVTARLLEFLERLQAQLQQEDEAESEANADAIARLDLLVTKVRGRASSGPRVAVPGA